MTFQTKILAIGSPYGDDRLGWEIAKRLPDFLSADITIQALDRPGLSILSYLSNTSLVLLIDAIHSGTPPGTIHWLTGDDIPKTDSPASSHNIGISEVYQLGKVLNILPQQLHFCGIEMDPNWHSQEALSPSALSAIPILLEQIKNFIHIHQYLRSSSK